MSQRTGRLFIVGLIAHFAGFGLPATGTELAWDLAGFDNPEAVLLSDDGRVLYVSNTNGGPAEKNGMGYISLVAPNGTLVKHKWVDGLDAPKGMLEVDGVLYVTDIERVVAIDPTSGSRIGEWSHDEAIYLNGLTADDQGGVYASDTAASKIFRLANDQLEPWVGGEVLDYPNGLRFEDGRILVAGWGKPNEDWTTEIPGHVKAVDVATGGVSSLSDGKPIGNLDGIRPDGASGWLVTDFMGGAIFRIDEDGPFEQVLDLDPGSADFEFIQADRLAIVPMFLDGKIVAYRLD